ncbi:hypothetical protein [Euzebya tangerina]|uniref:hypothetical protein n=1 Tax=Euzebya tangerina TaxID=591198 RepID=UPI000E310D6A|nr:hypothetical protein [Euzebya tangerina]
MTTIVISGEDADTLAERLSASGHDTVTATDPADLDSLDVSSGTVDLYVQLPVRVGTAGRNAVDVISHFLREGLLRRFDAASTVLPLLAPTAGVLLVAGNHPDDSSAPDNPEARIALMKVLGHGLLLDRPTGLSVSIVGSDASPERMEELVDRMLQDADTLKPFAVWLEKTEELSDEIPAWDYADWRNALLTMGETLA